MYLVIWHLIQFLKSATFVADVNDGGDDSAEIDFKRINQQAVSDFHF